MNSDRPDYEEAIAEMLAGIDAVRTWESEPKANGGTDYQVYAAEGYTASEAAEAVEMAPVPGGHPITISSATSEWFWLGAGP